MRAALAIAVVVGLLVAPAATARPLDKLDARLKQLATGKACAQGRARRRERAARGRAGPRRQGAGRRLRARGDARRRGRAARARACASRRSAAARRSGSSRAGCRSPAGRHRGAAHARARSWPCRSRSTTRAATPPRATRCTAARRCVRRASPAPGIPVGVMSDSINKRGTGVAGVAGDRTTCRPTVQILDEPGVGHRRGTRDGGDRLRRGAGDPEDRLRPRRRRARRSGRPTSTPWWPRARR